jgi:hypothetical protein
MNSTSGMNGVNPGFVDELNAIGIALRQDESVRCVTLTGSDGVASVPTSPSSTEPRPTGTGSGTSRRRYTTTSNSSCG